MKLRIFLALAAAALVVPSVPAGAKEIVVAQAETMSEGEVTKVDTSAKKLTVRHGPLANLDMPAMTMVFALADEAMLDQVAPGDQIRFVADRVRGQITITKIEK